MNPSYGWYASQFTPWARGALHFAGYTSDEIASRQPAGWTMTGSGRTSGGPFTFRLREKATGRELIATAHTLHDVRAAVERLTGDNALEEQLRASLERIG